VLALGALSGDQARSDEKRDDLIRASFGNEMQDGFETKARTVITLFPSRQTSNCFSIGYCRQFGRFTFLN
jgi:hypothetical protein